jgi:hypothetical protein
MFENPCPGQRAEFLARNLTCWETVPSRNDLVRQTEGLSFAHLQEFCWGVRFSVEADQIGAAQACERQLRLVKPAGSGEGD